MQKMSARCYGRVQEGEAHLAVRVKADFKTEVILQLDLEDEVIWGRQRNYNDMKQKG